MTVTNDHMSKKSRVLKANASETDNIDQPACEKTRQRILKTPENYDSKPGQVAGRKSGTKSFTPNTNTLEAFKENDRRNERTRVYASYLRKLSPKMPDNNNVRGIFYFFILKKTIRNCIILHRKTYFYKSYVCMSAKPGC